MAEVADSQALSDSSGKDNITIVDDLPGKDVINCELPVKPDTTGGWEWFGDGGPKCDANSCDDGNPCTEDLCNYSTGCYYLPAADGAPCISAGGCATGNTCHGGQACTVGALCKGGVCGAASLWQVDLFASEARSAVALWPEEDGGLSVVGDVSGQGPDAACRVARLSALGQVVWQQTSAMQSDLHVYGAARSSDGGYWAVGRVQDDPWLGAWSAAGTPLWSKTLASAAVDSAQAATPTAAGVVVCGLDATAGAWWATFDASGAQLAKTTIGAADATAIGALLALPGGDTVAALHSLPPPGMIPMSTLVRISPVGKVLWTLALGEGMGLRINGLSSAPGGIMAAGTLGWGADFSTDAGLLMVSASGGAPPTTYGMAGPGGSGQSLAAYGDKWLISLRHTGKSANEGQALALVSGASGEGMQQVPLISDVIGRVQVLARPDGWAALAQVSANGVSAWRVVRTDAAGKAACP